MKSIAVLLAVLLLLPASLFIAAGSAAADSGAVSKEAMIRSDADVSHLTILGLTPGRSTIAEVVSVLGSAEIEKIGRDERVVLRLCYVSQKEGDHAKLVFEASVFVDGAPGSVVNSIRLYSGDVAYDGADSCTSSSLISSDTVTEGGVGLAISEAQFIDRLGASPTDRWSGFVGFEYHATEKLSKAEVERLKARWPFVLKYPYLDIHSSVEARFYKGSLKRLDLSRIVAKP
jgi:hypothetical protein